MADTAKRLTRRQAKQARRQSRQNRKNIIQTQKVTFAQNDPGFSTGNDLRLLKHACLYEPMFFSRYFFKHREGRKFIVNEHHKIICDTLQKVIDGEPGYNRLVITVPPGYTKTEEAVIHFMARGLALNPESLFMHLSYSDDLALWNSTLTRDVVGSHEYQQLFNMPIRHDISSKKKWYTQAGGGVYATSAGGAVTGFRAGRMLKNVFSGALIIDDPIKPQDAYSDTKRELINDRFNSTFKSRLAMEDTTPIILIMQRVHEDDAAGFLLKGGTGEKWMHLNLPAMVPEEPVTEWYPKEYTYGIPVEYDLPAGPLWAFKHNATELKLLETADPYTYAAQYMQKPSPKGGLIFKDTFWQYYSVLPKDIVLKRIYADTAQEVKTHNDYSVFQCWGLSLTKGIFLIDQIRGKWESPELRKVAKTFWAKHKFHHVTNPVGAQMMKIEKKSSGAGLLQDLRTGTFIPVEGIERSRDKVMRAFDTVPQIASGNVHIPIDADFTLDYVIEHGKFSPLMTHKNDDQIDPTMDAIEDLLINQPSIYEGAIT
jgi:predicted phage terminase large subunit-like protein